MNDERRDGIDRILTLLGQLWHARPDVRLGEMVCGLGSHYPDGDACDPWIAEDDVLEAALTNAIATLDHKPFARHPAGCVVHSNAICVWLRDGTKVTLKRDAETTGRAWLEVEKQATVHLAETKVEEPALPPPADWPTLSAAEKCEAVLKRILVLVNERDGLRVTFEGDWGGNTFTVYVDNAHSHTGVPDGTWEGLVDGLHGLLCKGVGLSWHRKPPAEAAKAPEVCKTCGADPDEDLEVERDAVAEWLEAHQDEVLKYQGKRIAVHPEKGIVASGETFSDVYAEVKKLGLLGGVCFDAVPRSSEPGEERSREQRR